MNNEDGSGFEQSVSLNMISEIVENVFYELKDRNFESENEIFIETDEIRKL